MATNPGDITYEIDPAQSDAVSFGQVLGARGDVNFEEAGSLNLTAGVVDIEITFLWQKETADYRFEYCYIEDSNGQPEDIRAVVNERTSTGFTLKLSAAPDTDLSILRWKITTPDALHLTQPPTSQPRYVLAGDYQPLHSNLTTLAGLTFSAYGLPFLSLVNEAGARTYIDAQQHSDALDLWSGTNPTALGLNFITAETPGITSFVKVTHLDSLIYVTPAQVLTELGAITGVAVTGNNGITVAGSGTGAITLGLGSIVPSDIMMASGNVVLGPNGSYYLLPVVANTATAGIGLIALEDATAANQRYSPFSYWRGSGWKTNATAAAENVEFRAYTVPVQGVSHPTGYFVIESSVNDGSFANGLRLFTSGGLTLGSATDPGALNFTTGGSIVLGGDISAVGALTAGSGSIIGALGCGTLTTGTATIGSGTPILKVLSAQGILGFFTAVANAKTSIGTITVTGAATGDMVSMFPSSVGSCPAIGLVTAANTVTVYLVNPTIADEESAFNVQFRAMLTRF